MNREIISPRISGPWIVTVELGAFDIDPPKEPFTGTPKGPFPQHAASGRNTTDFAQGDSPVLTYRAI